MWGLWSFIWPVAPKNKYPWVLVFLLAKMEAKVIFCGNVSTFISATAWSVCGSHFLPFSSLGTYHHELPNSYVFTWFCCSISLRVLWCMVNCYLLFPMLQNLSLGIVKCRCSWNLNNFNLFNHLSSWRSLKIFVSGHTLEQ